MRRTLILFCIALSLVLSIDIIYASSSCLECDTLAGVYQAKLSKLVDTDNKVLEIIAFYENFSESPPRQMITNSVIIIEIINSTGLARIYKTYTNDQGSAFFDFSEFSTGCINIKVLYCPFCAPGSLNCGFLQCLEFANIKTGSGFYDYVPDGIGGIDDIPNADDAPAVDLADVNTEKYLPQLTNVGYCAPPPPLAQTPAMCLPLLIIFSLLSGSLYMSGRNPFSGFNIGGARIGRHIRYQARGRGFYFSGIAAIGALTSAVGAIRTAAKKGADGKRGGAKAIVAGEKAAAQNRVFGLSQVRQIKSSVSRAKQIGGFIKMGGGGKAINKRIQATSGSGSGSGSNMVRDSSGNMISVPGGSSGSSPRFSEMFGRRGGYGFGFLVYLLSTTTVGGAIFGIISAATGRSVFEMLFVSRNERALDDSAALLDIAQHRCAMNANGEIEGINVDINGHRVVVTGVHSGENGAVIYDIRVAGESEGAEPRNMQLTIDSQGNIAQVSYTIPSLQVGVGIPEAADALPDSQRIIVTAGPDGRAQFSAQFQVNGEGGQPETRTILLNGTTLESDLNAWNALTGQYYGGEFARLGLDVGTHASDLTQPYTDARNDLVGAMSSLEENLAQANREELSRLRDAVEGSEGAPLRLLLQDARADIAGGAVERAFGLEAGALETGEGAGLLRGVQERETDLVRSDNPSMDRASSLALSVRDSWVRSLGSSDFTSGVADASGHEGRQQREFSSAFGHVLSSHSPQALLDMTPAQFRDALVANGMDRSVADRVDARALTHTQSAVNNFRDELGTSGRSIGSGAIDRLFAIDVGNIRDVASAGGQVSDANAPSLLADRGVAGTDGVSESTAGRIREASLLGDMSSTLSYMRRALSSDSQDSDYDAFGRRMRHYADQTSDYLQQAAANEARSAGHLSDDHYGRINEGLDLHARSYRGGGDQARDLFTQGTEVLVGVRDDLLLQQQRTGKKSHVSEVSPSTLDRVVQQDNISMLDRLRERREQRRRRRGSNESD